MNWSQLAEELPSKANYWRKARRDGIDKEEEWSNYWMTLRKRQDTGTWNWSTRTHSIDNSLWKRLCACRKTDYVTSGKTILLSRRRTTRSSMRKFSFKFSNEAVTFSAHIAICVTTAREWGNRFQHLRYVQPLRLFSNLIIKFLVVTNRRKGSKVILD